MKNLSIMQSFESPDDLNENVPYFFFLNIGFPLLIAAYFLEHISVISILHYKTMNKIIKIIINVPQARARLVDKSFFVSNYICMKNTGKNSDFIQSILLFFIRKIQHFNFFESVNCLIFTSSDFIHLTVGSVTYLKFIRTINYIWVIIGDFCVVLT